MLEKVKFFWFSSDFKCSLVFNKQETLIWFLIKINRKSWNWTWVNQVFKNGILSMHICKEIHSIQPMIAVLKLWPTLQLLGELVNIDSQSTPPEVMTRCLYRHFINHVSEADQSLRTLNYFTYSVRLTTNKSRTERIYAEI